MQNKDKLSIISAKQNKDKLSINSAKQHKDKLSIDSAKQHKDNSTQLLYNISTIAYHVCKSLGNDVLNHVRHLTSVSLVIGWLHAGEGFTSGEIYDRHRAKMLVFSVSMMDQFEEEKKPSQFLTKTNIWDSESETFHHW